MEILLNILDRLFGLFAHVTSLLIDTIGFKTSIFVAFSILVFSAFMIFRTKKTRNKVTAIFFIFTSLCFLFFVLLIDGMATRSGI